MSDQILEKIQVVVCHGPHNYLLEEVGVPLRGESYEPCSGWWLRHRPSGSTSSTMN